MSIDVVDTSRLSAGQTERYFSAADSLQGSALDDRTAVGAFSSVLDPIGQADRRESQGLNADYGLQPSSAAGRSSDAVDLEVDGQGYLMVEDETSKPFLTRSGSFTPNSDGELVTEDGFRLLGFPYHQVEPDPAVNDYASLVPITISTETLAAVGTTSGTISSNLDAASPVIASGELPSATSGQDTKFTHKTTLTAIDTTGKEVVYDVYFSKTAEDTWQIAVFNSGGRSVATGSFPYASNSLLADPIELKFDPETGALTPASLAAAVIKLPTERDGGFIPDMREIALDFTNITQRQEGFKVTAELDGWAPVAIDGFEISKDGTVSVKYKNGDVQPRYWLGVATVEDPAKITERFYSPAEGDMVLLGTTMSVDGGAISRS